MDIKCADKELFILKKIAHAAEELGVTSKNLRSKTQTKTDLRLAKFVDDSGAFAKQLGVNPGWVRRIIESVGNYGEMFERNLGQGSALKLERGPNRLWTQGGLMYAPPFL